jgi:GAF domain-containing protein
VSDEKDKPEFDEQALGRLLEAAYVLQEHNRRLQEMELRIEPQAALTEPEPPAPPAPLVEDTSEHKPAAEADYTFTLGQIVEIQHQIQLHHLELDQAMPIIAEKVTQIARANGSAIGILESKQVQYRAASGEMALPTGTAVAMEKALCVASLRTGQVIRCPDVNTEFLLDADECRRRGIQSMIAVPVYYDGGIAGGLELYYTRPEAFTEQDVHTCQLMAGLVTEALQRHEEVEWKKSLAAERAVMQQAFDRIKPGARPQVPADTLPDSEAAYHCGQCGNALMAEEQFCGKCGTPRPNELAPPPRSASVKDVSTLEPFAPPAEPPAPYQVPGTPAKDPLSEFLSPTGLSEENSAESLALVHAPRAEHRVLTEKELEGTLSNPNRSLAWSSAASARDYLEQLAVEPSTALARFWAARRGDVYLAIAVILVAGVIRWGIVSNHSVSATANSTTASAAHRKPDADLSFYDRMLIKLGLAEAPEPVEYKGNPDTQVWVDLQTALYYCPGADLYGKTPKGRYVSQRDAQLDSFEPALRKACN